MDFLKSILKFIFNFFYEKFTWVIPQLKITLEFCLNKCKTFLLKNFPGLVAWLNLKWKEDWKPLYKEKLIRFGVEYRFQLRKLTILVSLFKKIKNFFEECYSLLFKHPELTFLQSLRLLVFKSKNRLRYLLNEKYREYHLSYTNWYYIWSFEFNRFFAPIFGILKIFYEMLDMLIFSKPRFKKYYSLFVMCFILVLFCYTLFLFAFVLKIFFILMTFFLHAEHFLGLVLILCSWWYIFWVWFSPILKEAYKLCRDEFTEGKIPNLSQEEKEHYWYVFVKFTPENYPIGYFCVFSTISIGILFLFFCLFFCIFIYFWVHFCVLSGENVPLFIDFYFFRFERTWFFNSELFENLTELLKNFPESFSNYVDKEQIVRESHHNLSTMKNILEDLFQSWKTEQENLANTRWLCLQMGFVCFSLIFDIFWF